MGKKTTNKRAGPLYRRAVLNIQRAIREAGLTDKEVATAVGLDQSVFAQKQIGVRSHFYEDEMDDLRRLLAKKTGRPLTGFPHLEWDVMELADRTLGSWKP